MEWLFAGSYLLLGGVTGVVAGLLGVGGGLVVVPALIVLFSWQHVDYGVILHLAIGTSLATIVPTAMASGYAHSRRGSVLWPAVRSLSPGLLIGAIVGALIADRLDTVWLQRCFGIFAVLVGLQMLLKLRLQLSPQLPQTPVMLFAGSLIGTVSGLVGIGGGSMTVPFLNWHGVSMRQAVATSSVCGLPIAIAGLSGFVVAGWGSHVTPAYSTGYVYWPAVMMISIVSVASAPLGAALAHRLPVVVLKRIFSVVMLVIGARLLGVV